jgi:hemerythrin-like domain-containing protein
MPDRLPSTQRQTIEQATQEAESRTLEYDPNVRAQYVRAMIRDIPQWLSNGDTEQTIRDRVTDFADNYPELFKKLINKEDLTPLQSMIAMLDRMGEGNLSQHQASIIIGKKMVDRFVTPQLNK